MRIRRVCLLLLYLLSYSHLFPFGISHFPVYTYIFINFIVQLLHLIQQKNKIQFRVSNITNDVPRWMGVLEVHSYLLHESGQHGFLDAISVEYELKVNPKIFLKKATTFRNIGSSDAHNKPMNREQ